MPNSKTAFDVESSSCNSGYLMRSKNLAHLVASNDGWSLHQVIDWLYDDGKQIIEPTQFTDELCPSPVKSRIASVPATGVKLYAV